MGVTEMTGESWEADIARLHSAAMAGGSKDDSGEYQATEDTCWNCQHRKLVCEHPEYVSSLISLFCSLFCRLRRSCCWCMKAKKRCHMMEVGSRKRRTEKTEMSEKAKGKRKVTETDDEGAEHEEKTDGGRKRRRVTVRDPEETDWVQRVTVSCTIFPPVPIPTFPTLSVVFPTLSVVFSTFSVVSNVFRCFQCFPLFPMFSVVSVVSDVFRCFRCFPLFPMFSAFFHLFPFVFCPILQFPILGSDRIDSGLSFDLCYDFK